MKEGSGNTASLSVGLCQGNHEGRGGSFTGDLEGYVKEGSGDRHLSP